MKTSYLKAFLVSVLLGAASIGESQALVAIGHFKTNTEETTEAYYSLSNPYEHLQAGKCSELTLRLGYNESYTLTVSKPGYQTKKIVFSTFDNTSSKQKVVFTVILKRFKIRNVGEPDMLAGRLYYDRKSSEYKSISYSEKGGIDAEREMNQKKVAIR